MKAGEFGVKLQYDDGMKGVREERKERRKTAVEFTG